ALNLLGAEAEELIGSRAALAGWLVTDVAGWPDAENLHPAIAAIRSQHAQREVVARVIRPDGAEVWIQIDAVPVTTSTGSVSHVVTTLADLTRVFHDARLPRSGYGDHALAAITDQLAGSRLDPAAILQAVTSTLSKLRSGTWMAALMNKDPGTLRIVAANDADPEVAAYIENIQLRPNAPTFTISSRVIDSGEPVLIPNVAYDEFIGLLNTDIRDYVEKNAPPISFPAPHLGVLVVPMRARGAVVGTLGLFEPRGSKPLTERDVRWAQAIADRIGLATDNAQLYVDAVTRLERLTALRSVGLAMSGSNDLRLTLQVILDQAVAGLGVDAADILLLNEKDGLLGLMASTGFHSTSLPDYRLPVDDKLPGRAFFSSRTETVTTMGFFSQFRRRSLFAREGFQAYGAVSLITQDKLVGVLEVFHRTQLQPDNEWVDFLDALGSDAALAIDRAALVSRLQQTTRDGASKPSVALPDLTHVEKEILRYLVEGLPNRAIADKVHLSQNTIKFHVSQMLDKGEVSNRTELARKATQEGWL
ncbi:MAG TPA: GAF domain-containing protein, partial [Candidatus Eisenbacteria bacterium]|nr:GAF domain-containing protein [Candidatus Eisenbacteria bacterium]